MKRFSQLVFFYAVLFSSAIFIQSCCLGEHNITGNGSLSIVEGFGTPVDTLSGPFRVVLEPTLTLSDSFKDLSLLHTSYAVTCDNPIENRIDVSSVEVILDQSITLSGDPIDMEANLIGRQGVTFVDGDYSGGFLELTIEFDQSFMDNVVFETNEYEFTVRMSTDDGVDIENSASVFVQL